MYADLTEEQKERIKAEYDHASRLTDVKHAIMISAANGLGLTNRQLNGKTGSNAFAAALAVLVMSGKVDVN